MIYTFGYYGKDFQDFKTTVSQLNAVVVDIRLVPRSRFFPAWNKSHLQQTFGEAYVHIPELGNKGFKEKRIEIADIEHGLAKLRAIKRDLILICACKFFNRCHRKPITRQLQSLGYEVRELYQELTAEVVAGVEA
jgi:uncharacterized protein (DUF488 family)